MSQAAFDNAEFVEAGGLSLADAFLIHDALHAPDVHQVKVSTGHVLPITISHNGCRRCDVVIDAARPLGRCKLMAQNTSKQSGAAKRALRGAKISHILPLDRNGKHTQPQYSHDWGCIEDGRLTKNCAAALNQDDVSRHTGKPKPPPKRKADCLEQGPRTYLDCPFAEKDDAKRRGAKWDAEQRAWFVPFAPGRDMAPFARWLRDPVPTAAGGT